MYLRTLTLRAGALLLAFCAAGPASAAAQPVQPAAGVTVSGRLYHSISLKPIADATVAIEGTKLETTSKSDGSYSIPNVPAGPYHLLVIAKGFVPARAELAVASVPVTLDVPVDPELHYS